MPLLRNPLFPLTWVLGKRPFFFIIIVIDNKMKLMAIIINVNIKVLNIVCNIYKLQNRIKKLLFFTLH